MSRKAASNTIRLDGRSLTPEALGVIAHGNARLELTDAAMAAVADGRKLMARGMEEGWPIYAATRGTGQLRDRPVALTEAREHAQTSTRNRFVYGAIFPAEVGRAALAVTANTLLHGRAGVRATFVAHLVEMVNGGLSPALSEEVGLLGMGDLGAMEQLGATMSGEGHIWWKDTIVPARQAYAAVGLEPLQLDAPEPNVLAGSNGVTLALACLTLLELEELSLLLDATAALALEGYGANLSMVRPEVSAACPLPGHVAAATRLRQFLAESPLLDHASARNIQDPLSFRSIPQVHGSLHDALTFLRKGARILINGALSNPIVVTENEEIFSNANFDMTRLSISFDLVRIMLGRVARMSVERIQKQMWPAFSSLPTGLQPVEGLGRGLNELGRFAAQLASEVNRRVHPTSGDATVALADGINDQMSGAPVGILVTREAISKLRRLLGLELIVSAQAFELRGAQGAGVGSRAAFDYVRERVPFLEERSRFQADLEQVHLDVSDLVSRLLVVVAGG